MNTNSVVIEFSAAALIATRPAPVAPDFDVTLPHTVVHFHSQRCTFCGDRARWSKVYECTTRERGRKLAPIQIINPDLPVQAVLVREELVPMCSACVGTRPVPDAEAHARWAETLKRKAEAPKPEINLGPALEDL